jgi:hypothetical protein
MKIKSLKYTHPLIYKRILECQENQGNNPDDTLELGVNLEDGNFVWASTTEGVLIWSDVDEGKFESWYQYHNLPIPKEIIISNHKQQSFAFKLNVISALCKISAITAAAICFLPEINISIVLILLLYTIGQSITIFQSKTKN